MQQSAEESLVHVARFARALAPALSTAGLPAESLSVDGEAELAPEEGDTLRVQALTLHIVVRGPGSPDLVESVAQETVHEWSLFTPLLRRMDVRIASIRVEAPEKPVDETEASQESPSIPADPPPVAVSPPAGASAGGVGSTVRQARPLIRAGALLLGGVIAVSLAALIGWRIALSSGVERVEDRPSGAGLGAVVSTDLSCPAPAFVLGFAALRARLGDTMGEPLECERVDPETGDSLQQTTTGLAYYRKATNAPAFTDGYRHWALTADGLVRWEGDSVDPPSADGSSVPLPAG